MCVSHTHTCMHACHNAHMKVRCHTRVNSLLPPRMSQGTELVTRFGNKGLNLLDHLPSPKIYSYIVIACMYCLTQIKREYWKTLFWQWPLRKKGRRKISAATVLLGVVSQSRKVEIQRGEGQSAGFTATSVTSRGGGATF